MWLSFHPADEDLSAGDPGFDGKATRTITLLYIATAKMLYPKEKHKKKRPKEARRAGGSPRVELLLSL
jgi:hypothetical protein